MSDLSNTSAADENNFTPLGGKTSGSKFAGPKLVVALDYNSLSECDALVGQLNPKHCRLKVGKEMFTLYGPKVVEQLQSRGFDVFLDLKFHDIPATVAKAVAAAANLGVWMVNVHVSGGAQMMESAAEAISGFDHKPLLIGVTVLTSMSEPELKACGVSTPLQEHVLNLASMAKQSGLDGVVCSAMEASRLKAQLGKTFALVTPGIRPAGANVDDQKRIMTPVQAITAGSDFLVVGRPITKAPNPAAVCESIVQSIAV